MKLGAWISQIPKKACCKCGGSLLHIEMGVFACTGCGKKQLSYGGSMVPLKG